MTVPPIFAALAEVVPPAAAMHELRSPMGIPATPEGLEAVGGLASTVLQALAWLYLDDLERAHDLCQSMDDATGAALHAIVHRREGDYANALYWWRRAGDHPALVGTDPVELTKAVRDGDLSERTIDRQRAEWAALAVYAAA